MRVEPVGGTAFEAEVHVPMRAESLHKLRSGTVLEVRYRRSAPTDVVVDRLLREGPEARRVSLRVGSTRAVARGRASFRPSARSG